MTEHRLNLLPRRTTVRTRGGPAPHKTVTIASIDRPGLGDAAVAAQITDQDTPPLPLSFETLVVAQRNVRMTLILFGFQRSDDAVLNQLASMVLDRIERMPSRNG